MKPGGLTLFLVSAALAAVLATSSAAAGPRPTIRLRPATIGLFHRTVIAVRGVSARSLQVRLRGATDATGLAYERTPYPWHRLRRSAGIWTGSLPAPALLGVYELELRLDGGRTVVSSPQWLLRVFERHTLRRPSFSTPALVVRDYVDRLPGDEVAVAVRPLRPAAFDRRDPRLHRIFAVAYAPRGDTRPASRLGVFVTAVRDGLHGSWRLLEASVEPYD